MNFNGLRLSIEEAGQTGVVDYLRCNLYGRCHRMDSNIRILSLKKIFKEIN